MIGPRSSALSHHVQADERPGSPQGSSVSAASTGRSNRATVGTSYAAVSDLGSIIDDEQFERPLAEVRARRAIGDVVLPGCERLKGHT